MVNFKGFIAAVGLSSAILLSGCGSNNSDLQSQLESANSRISELEAEVAQKDSTISNLNAKIEAMTPQNTGTESTTSSDASESESHQDGSEQLATSNIVNFDGLQIEFTQNVKVDTVDNEYSEYNGTKVIGVPITITNVSDDTNYLNMFYLKVYGSSGVQSKTLNNYFDDGDMIYNKLRSGASVEGYIYIPYDGDGDYYVSFDNIVDDPIDQLIHIELG